MLAMLGTSFLQRIYFPPEPPQENQTLAQADSDINDNAAETSPATPANGSANLSDKFNDLDATPVDTGNQQGPERSGGTDTQIEKAEFDDSVGAPPTVAPEEQAVGDSALYSLGSVGVDSEFRFLITFDSAGGTVRRVELNFRDRKGKFRYRDLENRSGYLGELDCVTTPIGCKVRVVGNGTPAQVVGLQPGDILKAMDGEPITTADDWQKKLARTKPGQSIELFAERGEEHLEQTFQIRLTDKPMEMIRPDPDFLEAGHFGRPSFRTTLLEPTPLKLQWPELDPGMMDAIWQMEPISDREIKFSFTVSDGQIRKREIELAEPIAIKGPIRVSKSYTLQPVADNSIHAEGQRDFHFDLKLEIENLSDSKQQVTCQLDGPLGTPTETWWYQNKIHGRNSAIGYVAGARDVIASTAQNEFTFFGGPEIVANVQKTEPKFQWLLKPPTTASEESQAINYLSVDAQYFNVALLPSAESEPFTAYSVLADVSDVSIPDNKRLQRLVDCTFRMFKTVDLATGENWSQSFEIFAGPKEPKILDAYGLGEVRSFGWFAVFSKPLCWLLEKFYYLTFQWGYGIPIILLTVLVRSCMIPISRKAALNAQMMQYLQPQMKELADKYKDDMEKRGQAQRDLFKKYKYNPFGGCFMALLQIPIFIGLYRGLSVDIALRDQPLFPGLSWCSNLSAPDFFWYWKDTLPGFMNFLTDETGWLGPYLNILPIITCVLFVVQQKLFTPPPTDEQQEMMHKVMKYMTIFMGVLFFKVPAGLCLYFITSSAWGIAERKMLPKPELNKSRLDDVGESIPDKAEIRKLERKKVQLEKADIQRQLDVENKKRIDRERKKKLKNRGV